MEVTDTVVGFEDTFWGPNDKKYMDRLARDMVRLRGIDIYYFMKADVPARIDGHIPLSNNPNRGDFDPTGRAGTALYGEPIHIGRKINAVGTEVTPVWNYKDPIKIRGVAFRPVQSDTPDERGHILTLKLTLQLARSMCDELQLVPQIGDIVQVPALLDNFYDIELLRRDSNRFGGTGFFTAWELDLVRSSKFVPERKNLPGVPTTGAFPNIIKETADEEQGKPAKGDLQTGILYNEPFRENIHRDQSHPGTRTET